MPETLLKLLKIVVSKLELIEKAIPFIFIILCVAVVMFSNSEVLLFVVFAMTLGIYTWRKYDSMIAR